MPRVVINPFTPLPTQNRHSGLIFVDKRLLSAYFNNFFAPLEPHLTNFEPGKLVKFFSLNGLFAIPTSFQHPSIKYGFIDGLHHENANCCPSVGLFEPLDSQMGDYLLVLRSKNILDTLLCYPN